MRVARLDHPDLDVDIIVSNRIEETLRARAFQKEPELLDWLASFAANSVFWDIGANVGSYSLAAAALGHQVHAFEPALPNSHRMLQNATLNGLGVYVYPIALGSRDGFTDLPLTSLEPGATHGTRYPDESMSVLTLTARHLVCHLKVPAPDHVKLDVDGAEVEVLRGFGLDPVCRPKSWLIETSPESEPEVSRIMEGWGYRLTAIHPRSEPGTENRIYA